MSGHEEATAQLHGTFVEETPGVTHRDLTGAPLPDYMHDHEKEKETAIGNTISDSDDNGITEEGDEPNYEERQTLRREGESMPLATWLIAVVELCERFTYYGAQTTFSNYVNIPRGSNLAKYGGLGLGTQGSTGLVTFFSFWCYVTPILGAIIADQYLGRYKTIVYFCIVYVVGLLVLWITALPVALDNGAGLGGFIAAILIIGVGTGGIKSNVAPLIADQYQRRKMAIKTLASGERIVIDPAITMQRIYMIFYWCINLGALSGIATVYMERYTDFWSAYLLCFCAFIVGFVVLVVAKKQYVVRPPTGSIITNAFKAMWQMTLARNQDAPKPSYKVAHGKPVKNNWDDQFIDELKRALIACQIFVFYPIFWVCYGQFSGNFVIQALEMRGHGIPNDLMPNFDPISIIVFIPILDRLVYPPLRKRGIMLRPVTRITIGFVIAGFGMLYAAIVQYFIYKTGPCFDAPLACPAALPPGATVAVGNNVHIAIQTPAYVLIGISEIFISVTGLEYAYTKAPPRMKSFVQSMYLLTNAFGSAIGEAFVSVSLDPKFTWLYVGLCVASIATGGIFWFLFKHLNAEEEALNELTKDDPILKRGSISGDIDPESAQAQHKATRGASVVSTGSNIEPQEKRELRQL